jgi:hypothetical protein
MLGRVRGVGGAGSIGAGAVSGILTGGVSASALVASAALASSAAFRAAASSSKAKISTYASCGNGSIDWRRAKTSNNCVGEAFASSNRFRSVRT